MNKAAVKSASSTTAARMRSGAHYLAAIKDDGLRVLRRRNCVRDVTSHPAFKGAARSLARLFTLRPIRRMPKR